MTTLLQRAEAYVGRPYEVGVFDCADLAVLVQREVFGRCVALPTHRQRPGGLMGQAREIHALRGALATPIAGGVSGAGVLMFETVAQNDVPSQLWHIGTVFVQGGETWVLHNSHAMGCAALHRLRDLRRWGLQLEGFYAWNDNKECL